MTHSLKIEKARHGEALVVIGRFRLSYSVRVTKDSVSKSASLAFAIAASASSLVSASQRGIAL